MLFFKTRIINSLSMRIKLFILIIFLNCNYSPWETPGTINGQNAKSEIKQMLYFDSALEIWITGLSSANYKKQCGQELSSFIGVNFSKKLDDKKLYKVDTLRDCKNRIRLYAVLIASYASNVDKCIFSRLPISSGEFDCNIEEANTFQFGKNGFL